MEKKVDNFEKTCKKSRQGVSLTELCIRYFIITKNANVPARIFTTARHASHAV